MSKPPIHPEDDLERTVLQRARTGLGPSPLQRRLTLARLATALATAPPSLAAPPALSRRAPRFSLQTLLSGIVAGSVVGFAIGASSPWQTLAPPTPIHLAAALHVPASRFATTMTLSPAVSPAEPGLAVEQLDLPPASAPRPSRLALSAKAQPAKPTLYEELSAVRRAQSALKSGQATLALGLMKELDESHPRGALLAERNVTKVLALCQLERSAEAKSIANRLLRNGRDAELYRARLAASCAGSTISSKNE